MKIILLWRNVPGQNRDAERVASDLWGIYAPLFRKLPEPTIRQTSVATLVFLELPVRGWKPRFFEEDEETWALAPDYPVDARAVLEANGTSIRDDDVLLTLGRKLQENPAPLLKEMAPHFSLIWSSKRTGEFYVQNDGLGRSQLFEYRKGETWALTNRIFAFKALGLPLEPVPENWAVRWTLQWFPMNLTGYKSIHMLEPATHLCISSNKVNSVRHAIVSEWIRPNDISREECVELARWSMLNQIRSVLPHIDKPVLHLSGGWDSRAVGSSLRASGVEFTVEVRGQTSRPDVIVATELAKIADLELKRDDTVKLPPDHVADCRRCNALALLWLAGDDTPHKSKLFVANGKQLEEGSVTIEGRHGGIAKEKYLSKLKANTSSTGNLDDYLLKYLLKKMPPFIRTDLRDRVREIIRAACSQADEFGLSGLKRLEYFYLSEEDRRKHGSHLNRRTGLIFSPFLNPDFIRAAFAYPGDDKKTKPFHRYIIERNAPDWANVRYANDVEKSLRNSTNPRYGRNKRFDYDNHVYYHDIAKPLIDECLNGDGFWTEIFDPKSAREQWAASPDELVITYLLPELCSGKCDL